MAKQDKLSKALVMMLDDLLNQVIEYIGDWDDFVKDTKLTLPDTGIKFDEEDDDEEPLNEEEAMVMAAKYLETNKPIREIVQEILAQGIIKLATCCYRNECEKKRSRRRVERPVQVPREQGRMVS